MRPGPVLRVEECVKRQKKVHWILMLNVVHDLGLSSADTVTLLSGNQVFQQLVQRMGH